MTEGNTDFALKNKNVENWTATQFWESDPMQQNQTLCRIMLYVNWEDKTATVETQMRTNSTQGEVWNGLASEFTIPEDTDFEEFAEYFKGKVQPVLQAIGEKFESFWNGSNWKGRFMFEGDVDSYGEWSKIENVLFDAPKHDKYYYFDVRDSFQNYNEIIDFLAPEIDFLKVDLSNMEIVRAIRSDLEDECIFLESDDEIQADLERMQESLIEEAEEDEEDE